MIQKQEMKRFKSSFVLNTKGKSLNDIVKNICGEKIGSGLFRGVYVFKKDDRFVVKVEGDPAGGNFCNVMEFRTWVNNKEWKQLSDWLVPCHVINETGQILIQERIQTNGKAYPRQIPSLFTDTKHSNYGWLDGRFVCCDYPNLLLGVEFKMKNVKWRKQ